MSRHRKINDQDIEVIMGSLLRGGVLISAMIVLIGGVLYLFQNGYSEPHYHTFKGEPSDLKSIKQIFNGVIKLRSLAIIQMGLLILIATPIARIIFSAIAFLLEGDYLYVFIALTVLGIICFSLLSGLSG